MAFESECSPYARMFECFFPEFVAAWERLGYVALEEEVCRWKQGLQF